MAKTAQTSNRTEYKYIHIHHIFSFKRGYKSLFFKYCFCWHVANLSQSIIFLFYGKVRPLSLTYLEQDRVNHQNYMKGF